MAWNINDQIKRQRAIGAEFTAQLRPSFIVMIRPALDFVD
jgi:hypothetical protein